MNEIQFKGIKMETPKIPENEAERLKSLEKYNIIDTLPEESYDEITSLAAYICETPIALVSLVDENRQCFKSHLGLNTSETSRKYSFCAHAINNPNEPFIIEDATKDSRFHDNPLVADEPYLKFYAGYPLVNPDGYPLGSLCVLDYKPRTLSDSQIKALKNLSNQVVRTLELRKHQESLTTTNRILEDKNKELEQFAYRAAHDLKSPLKNLSGLVDFCLNTQEENLDEEGQEMLKMMDQSSEELQALIEGILHYSRSDKWLQEERENVDVKQLLEEVKNLLDSKNFSHFHLPQGDVVINTHKVALKQVFMNLLSNSIKYCDKEELVIQIDYHKDDDYHYCSITDNGPGIPKQDQSKLFELFEVLNKKDKAGNKGTGIGLATVKKLVEGLGGKITVDSEEGNGTTFHLSIAH